MCHICLLQASETALSCSEKVTLLPSESKSRSVALMDMDFHGIEA